MKQTDGRKDTARGLKAFFAGARVFKGGYAALLTAGVIVLAVLINILSGYLEDRFALTRDYSFNSLTVQSETTRKVLAALDRDVHVYYVRSAAYDTSALSFEDAELILNRYRAQSGKLSWSEEDIVRNPSFQERFSAQLNGETIPAQCLVVHCPDTDRVRVLSENDLLSRSYDLETGSYYVSGYQVEKKLTEAILYVSREEVPGLQILTGHGELTAADLGLMTQLLHDNSYETVFVSALDQLDTDRPLLIACPQFDLTEDELNALLDYARSGGAFLTLSRYSDPSALPRISQLYLYFGVRVLPGLCVAQAEDTESYYNASPAVLAPYMQDVPELTALTRSGRDFLLLPGARAFEILPERDASVFSESLLRSGAAYLHQPDDENQSLERAEGDPEGYFDLAVYARRYYDDDTSSRMILVGNADLFCEEWLLNNTYAPEFLMALMKTLNGGKEIDLDIVQKDAVRAPLRISGPGLPAALSLALPLMVFLAALFVLLPRRNL